MMRRYTSLLAIALLATLVSCTKVGGEAVSPGTDDSGKEETPQTNYAVQPASATIKVGEELQLQIVDEKKSAVSVNNVSWTSSFPDVASVSSTGLVKGLKVGNTSVSAVVDGKTYTSLITVETNVVKITSISLDNYELHLYVGDESQLHATIHPEEAAGRKVSWMTTNKAVATVDEEGLITALEEGEASIFARIDDVVSDACNVIVEERVETKYDVAANCHMVLPGGTVVFPANRGNSNNPLQDIVSTEVLWESFCRGYSDQKAKVGDVIKSVTYSEGNIIVKTQNHDGNAVVAVLNDLGVILWSWHIWVTDYTADLDKGELDWYDGAYVYMMDRNLGALSNEPGRLEALGMYYQWGRKDPFYTGKWNCRRSLHSVSASRSWDGVSNYSSATLDYSIAHPMTGIDRTGTGDWLPQSDNTLWNSSKGIYDPCPPGFRVPSGGEDGFFAKSWLNLDYVNNYVWVEATSPDGDKINGYRFVINNNRETAFWPDGYGMTAGSFYSDTGYWSDCQYKSMVDDGYILNIEKGKVSKTSAMKREFISVRCQRM